MDANVLRCGACGGTIGEGVGTCPYCHATIESRHCLACFHANLATAAHCAACGRELGLEVVPEGDTLRCPSCAGEVDFVAIPAGRGAVHECPRCAGQFVDHETLRSLFEERAVLGRAAPRSAAPAQALGPVRYLPCPVCHARMNRKNFAERSGVIVDVCKAHGIWFDHGELPRVLAFVEAGGLREAERRAEEQKRALSKQAAGAAAYVSSTDGYSDARDLWTELLRGLTS